MADNDVVLDPSSPYLPMAIKDKKETIFNELRKLEVEPQINHGIYILKFAKSQEKHPLKIFYTVNNQ